jgi:chorismate dehydratase
MKTLTRTIAKVGKIQYKNCLPFYYELFERSEYHPEQVKLYENYPTKINEAMRKGTIDIAPVSSLEYANHQDLYDVIPGVTVATKDYAGSVILFSKKKIDSLNGAKIALTNQSLSSATLLKVLLKSAYKFENEFQVVTASNKAASSDAVLLIGDEALFFKSERFPYKYDLGKLWWDWTEKPFCFALWVVRKEFARKNRVWVNEFSQNLKINLQRNLTNIEGFLKESLGIHFLDEEFSILYGYYFNLHYFLDEDVIEGMELFFRLSKRLGLSPKQEKISFF